MELHHHVQIMSFARYAQDPLGPRPVPRIHSFKLVRTSTDICILCLFLIEYAST